MQLEAANAPRSTRDKRLTATAVACLLASNRCGLTREKGRFRPMFGAQEPSFAPQLVTRLVREGLQYMCPRGSVSTTDKGRRRLRQMGALA